MYSAYVDEYYLSERLLVTRVAEAKTNLVSTGLVVVRCTISITVVASLARVDNLLVTVAVTIATSACLAGKIASGATHLHIATGTILIMVQIVIVLYTICRVIAWVISIWISSTSALATVCKREE
jgi:hypothetical protein